MRVLPPDPGAALTATPAARPHRSGSGPAHVIATDGAARGNPGPAGIGVVITDPQGEVVAEIAEGIGVATNNVAEYRAAIEGLRRAADLGARSVVLRSDSRLLVEQLAGRFRVRNPTLIRLHHEARTAAKAFDHVRFQHVPRERNRAADRLANRGVDSWLAESGRGYEPPAPDPDLFDPS